jgi:isoamylase
VSYTHKHNEANGEENHDGVAENYSDNYGIERPSDDPAVESLRKRQIKNILATLILSRGVPMLLRGDEFRRTQRGNKNAYCQGNEISWYDWALLKHELETYDFTRAMIRMRKGFPFLSEERFYTSANVSWFNIHGTPPAWNSLDRTLGCHLQPDEYNDQICMLF